MKLKNRWKTPVPICMSVYGMSCDRWAPFPRVREQFMRRGGQCVITPRTAQPHYTDRDVQRPASRSAAVWSSGPADKWNWEIILADVQYWGLYFEEALCGCAAEARGRGWRSGEYPVPSVAGIESSLMENKGWEMSVRERTEMRIYIKNVIFVTGFWASISISTSHVWSNLTILQDPKPFHSSIFVHKNNGIKLSG
jgi:hypothetical protein